MGIYLLNISVDADDPHPQNILEDLTYNDQESIIEIFVEKILGFENAIEEYDDHDTEDHNTKNIDKLDLIVHFSVEFTNSQPDYNTRRRVYFDYKVNLTKGFLQLNSPPPKIYFQQA